MKSTLSSTIASLVAVLALLGVVTPGAVSATPIQWTTAMGGNDHWYEFIEYGSPLSWAAAQTNAILKGGYLATLVTAPEDIWVYQNVVLPSRTWGASEYGPWLGGYQLPNSTEPRGGWVWVNNDGIFDNNYTNWNAPPEPNNSPPGEDVMHMFMPGVSGKWNDAPDSTLYGFNSYVLELDTIDPTANPAVPEPMSIVLGITGLGSVAGFRKLRRK